MHFQSVALVATLLFVVFIAVLRVPRRIRRWVILIVPVPTAFLLIRWADYRHAWPDLGAAVAISLAALGAWWVLLGRRLSPATDDNIRVWTKEDPF